MRAAILSDILKKPYSEYTSEWWNSAVKSLELDKLPYKERFAYGLVLSRIGPYIAAIEAKERRAFERAKKQAMQKTKEHFILYFLKEDKLTIDQIAEIAETTKEEVLRIQKKHKL